MDPQQLNFEAGQAQGQAQAQAQPQAQQAQAQQEKTNNLMDMASNAAQSAKETMTEAGQQMMATAQGAAEAVKNATGMNKN
ncbi:hypothetical protein VIGAN_04027700 [Vigna angularis var. angularis]|uniref:Pollen coat protein n=1 Tax=Vigna angularis var. angularis TaxID=157739 RepID=A0A0S3RRF3_PHAAN|nr:hypothetical protein VIGAN_04027700 [Vigna angularis var. angularis]